MARTPVVAGNWKMNTTPVEGLALCGDLVAALHDTRGVEVVVCPPFTHLAGCHVELGDSGIGLGAQNVFWEERGAFTGEVSAAMLRELVHYVIIGHSERRQFFGETDSTVQQRLQAALGQNLTPIVCVGETLAERDGGRVEAVLARQVQGALGGVEPASTLILAYEPVWAIGTGRAATADQANDAMAFIRGELGRVWNAGHAERTRILYGGSVTAQNAAELAAQPEIDGALVGGASLNAASFSAIAQQFAAQRASSAAS